MKAALLDLDGTLIHSRPGIIASIEAALAELGHARDPAADLGHVVGPPLSDVMAEVLAHYGDSRVAEAVAAYRRHYAATGMFASTVYDGMEGVLIAARQAGLRLYVATSKQTDIARLVLAHVSLDGYFHGVYGTQPGGRLDDKSKLLAHILGCEGIAAGDAVMVGDRRHDMEAARANGVASIGVLWGYGDRAELQRAGAGSVVSSPEQLAAQLCA